MRTLNPVMIIQPTPRWLTYSHLLPSVMCSLTFRSLAGIPCRTLVLEWSMSQQRGARILDAPFQPDNSQVGQGYHRLLRPQTNPTEHSSGVPFCDRSIHCRLAEGMSNPCQKFVARCDAWTSTPHDIWALSRAWSFNAVYIECSVDFTMAAIRVVDHREFIALPFYASRLTTSRARKTGSCHGF